MVAGKWRNKINEYCVYKKRKTGYTTQLQLGVLEWLCWILIWWLFKWIYIFTCYNSVISLLFLSNFIYCRVFKGSRAAKMVYLLIVQAVMLSLALFACLKNFFVGSCGSSQKKRKCQPMRARLCYICYVRMIMIFWSFLAYSLIPFSQKM